MAALCLEEPVEFVSANIIDRNAKMATNVCLAKSDRPLAVTTSST